MKKFVKYTAVFTLAASLLSPSTINAATSKSIKSNFLKERAPLPFLKNQKQTSESTFVVKYKNSISPSIHKLAGMNVVKSFPSLGYDIVKIGAGKNLSTALSVYEQYSAITSVSPSVQYKLTSSALNPKEDEAYHLSQLRIASALKLVPNKPITVAVIDQGVDTSHPDLTGNIIGTYNVVDPATRGARDFHGTHVAGIIAAKKDNKIGAYGVNPNAKILSVNVFDGNEYTSDYTISEGILYAVKKGAKVINMSLGGTMYSQLLDDTIQYAISKGVVVVAAAGNSGINEYSYPASYDGVISVGATNSQKQLASFSTYGPGVDVVAPGEFIYSTIYHPSIGSTYYYLSGTSMATPVVSGIASLLKTKYPNLTSYDVEQILEETSTDLGAKGYDIRYGYGLVDPVKALNYNINKLVSYKKKNDADILNSAYLISNNKELSGTISKPHQINRYKINVTAGDKVGITLKKLAQDFDDQISLRFYEGTSTTSSKPVVIDDVLAGQDEGTVYRATKSGTLVVEVMDKNARYGNSNYTVAFNKLTDVDEQTASKTSPSPIDSLPYSNNSLVLYNNTTIGARYFSYTPTEDETISMSLGALPGQNTSINVYSKEQWDKYSSNQTSKQPLPILSIDRNGTSEGENGAVTFKKDTSYIIELSSAPVSVFTLPKYEDRPEASNRIAGSLEQINFTFDKLSLPADEDGLVNTAQKINVNNGIVNSLDDSTPIDDDTVGMDEQSVQQVLDNSRQITLNQELPSFIQAENDVDWYTFTPSASELFQLNVNGKKDQHFIAQLYVYNPSEKSFEYVTSSYNYFTNRNYMENNRDIFASLEKGETYYVRVSSLNGLTNSQYKLTLTSHGEIDKDEYEPNDDFNHASSLRPLSELYGNFSSINDVDYYYFKNTSTKTILKGFEFMAFPISEDDTGEIPKILTDDLPINITVYEDTNGNRVLDESEKEKGSFYQNYGDFTKGSFEAKAKYGYFIEVANAYTDISNIHEYAFRFYSMDRADEDAKAKFKNGIPSITLPLKSTSKYSFAGSGFLNANVAGGDKDYFKFVNDKNRTISYSLTMPAPGMNGKISFYDVNGRYVASFDRYTYNDAEVGQIYLKKGTYYIRVEEVNGISDFDKYQLSITKN